MTIIKCKMCGGDIELSADKTFGTCESCGSTMTLPKVDDEQRAAAFNRGNHFRRIGEFDKALAVYERIVEENDADAEAHWCCALCRFGIEYVEDPTTYEWIPTCHRASFDSFLEDVDYLAAVEHSDGITKRQYQKDAAKIAEVQRGILATSQNEEPFDVFICYKESDDSGNRTVDSTLAQDIYYQLTEKGYRVFFSRITLEDKVGTEYEPYIFAALNSAKVMVAVGTKAEYFNAVWVKNEWSRFLALMKKDRSKLLLPCYRDMDPYDLPEQLSVLQSYDMSKIGFIQDLIRGVGKVLDADKKAETVKETVVVQQQGGGNADALLKRGNMALEDGDWAKADEFFEQALNQNPECAEAYLGKALAQWKICTKDEFLECYLTDDDLTNKDFQRARRFATGELKEFFNRLDEERRKYREETIPRLAAIRERLKPAAGIISAELSHTVGLKSDGTVVAVGRNWDGQCNVENWMDIVAIAVGFGYTVGLKSDGTVVAAGYNKDGQCNVENWTDIVAIAVGLDCTVGLKSDGTVVATDQSDVENWMDIVAIAVDPNNAVGLKSDGTVVAAGYNKDGQCNVENWTGIVAIAVGFYHTVGLKSDGTVVAAGYNEDGRCNVENWTDIVAIAAGEKHTVGLKSDGTVVAVGKNDDGRCNVSDWTDIVAIAAGSKHTVGLKSDGTVVAVGENDDGQCKVSGWKLFNSLDTLENERIEAKARAEQERKEATKRAEQKRQRAEQEHAEAEKRAEQSRQEKIQKLQAEKSALNAELSNLKGLFSGKRRKVIEVRLAEIEREFRSLGR
jgi:alpha-tubulin suppressor-like RCC1 family protein/tetratricopeptide (TPR) repeat protein